MGAAEIKRAIRSFKPSMLDRVATAISPQWGRDRMRARLQANLMTSGAYAGASKARRSMAGWSVSGGDSDADLLPDLPTLRERSRDLARNNPLARGSINTKVAHVVGGGLVLNPTIDAQFLGLSDEQADAWEMDALREFNLFARSADCDVRRTLPFGPMQELVFRSVLENGDVFALLTFMDDRPGPYTTAVQLIEADRVSNPEYAQDSKKVAGGIERNTAGAPVAAHVTKFHPGTRKLGRGAQDWQRVEMFGANTGRRNLLHIYRSVRVDQSRGVPDLAPVIEILRQLGDYTDAELTAAVISGLFTVFVETPGASGLGNMMPTTETGASSSDDDVKLASGAIVDLAPGEKVSTANPGRPNTAFDPFVQAILRQVGTALELPFELLVMHFTASYSAARAALLQAGMFFSARRQWLAREFCQPVYEAWMDEAISSGRLQAPGYFADPAIRAAYTGAEWIGPSMGALNPENEMKAAGIAEDRGWKTAAANTAELTGGIWERNHRQRVKEQRKRRDGGLLVDGNQAAQQPAPAPVDQPEQQEQS